MFVLIKRNLQVATLRSQSRSKFGGAVPILDTLAIIFAFEMISVLKQKRLAPESHLIGAAIKLRPGAGAASKYFPELGLHQITSRSWGCIKLLPGAGAASNYFPELELHQITSRSWSCTKLLPGAGAASKGCNLHLDKCRTAYVEYSMFLKYCV
jgi:hypothetical protein